MGGWWKPTSDAHFFHSEMTLKEMIKGLEEKPWNVRENMDRMKSVIYSNDISQYGQMFLEICHGEDKPMQIRFRGIRQRLSTALYNSAEELHVYLDDGNRLSYKSVSFSVSPSTLSISHAILTRTDHSISSAHLENPSAMNTESAELLNFKPGNDFPFSLRKDVILSEHSYISNSGQVVKLQRVAMNHGLSQEWALFKTSRESFKHIEIPHFEQFKDYSVTPCERSRRVLPFTHRSCQDPLFCGGKGANLARLKSIEQGFFVPSGLVVTTTAFLEHLENNKKLQGLVKKLSTTGLSLEDYIEIGTNVQQELTSSEVSQSLADEILRFGIESDKKYAVRSSAVGEDGSDLSSAGQLESVLNVAPDQIASKIIECWCSNFRREVITYRRTHGQVLNPAMAVVIQEMIVDGVAGVMFTCDPVKNDDGKMVINAIRGMGEDIVSGVVTPDEITIKKKGWRMTKPSPCCLDDPSLLNLGSVGLFLEKTFGRAQDVEFVVKDKEVFLVQSRDVTGRDRESQFELLTEFDDATLTEKEIFSTANVGEVLPVPLTPLEKCLFDCYDKTMANMALRDLQDTLPRHHPFGFHMHGQKILFNIGEMFLRQWEVYRNDRLAEISVAGVELFNEDMFKQAEQRFRRFPKLFLKTIGVMLKMMFYDCYRLLREITTKREEIESLTPKEGGKEFEILYQLQQKQIRIKAEILEKHGFISMFSSFTYIIVGMLIRGSEVGSMDRDMLSDIANVFSNCSSNVISADVPAALKKLARSIVSDGLAAKFATLEGEEAVGLVREKGKESKRLMEEFFRTHGHRGPKELYLRSCGWGERPEMLVFTLKTMMNTPEEASSIEESRSADDVIATLKCKPTGMRKWLMKYMVSQTHRGVTGREYAKNCLVKSVFELRTTTKMIGEKLFREGYLPDNDLFFFLTLEELRTIHKTRSAKLISRAMRRKQIFSQLEERQYDHIYHGNPEPIVESSSSDLTSSVSLGGTVVCEGIVVGRARVAKNLEEAKHTQPGEILITRCTDICWSPFFPIISGIVTEIGGLLSHGAVVAREYGLPSLIAVQHATNVFSTGVLCFLPLMYSLICMDFEIGYGRKDEPRLFETNEPCGFMMIYADSKDAHPPTECTPTRLIGGTHNETRFEVYRNRSKTLKRFWVSAWCTTDFCNGNVDMNLETGDNVLNHLTLTCSFSILYKSAYLVPAWTTIIISSFNSYRKAFNASRNEGHASQIDKELAAHPASYDLHGTRHFKGISCAHSYLHKDHANDIRISFRHTPNATHCKIDLLFDGDSCKFVRLHLKPWSAPISDVTWNTGFFATAELGGEDYIGLSHVCRTDYCTVNMYGLISETVRNSPHLKCIEKIIEESLDQHNGKLREAYTAHLALSPEDRERTENMVDCNNTETDTEKLDKQRTIPLIERFSKVDPELLRQSDYQIEMAKKSEMWIQRVIFSVTLFLICTLSINGMRRNRMVMQGAYA